MPNAGDSNTTVIVEKRWERVMRHIEGVRGIEIQTRRRLCVQGLHGSFCQGPYMKAKCSFYAMHTKSLFCLLDKRLCRIRDKGDEEMLGNVCL